MNAIGFRRLSAALLSALALAFGAALAASAQPGSAQPADLLFETDHLGNLKPGTELVYRFERSGSDPKMLGPSFTDEIRLRVDGVETDGSRDVDLTIFSGDRARKVGALPGLNGNPVLVSFLDRAVLNMVQLAGGNNAYFKNRFRAAILDKAKVEKTTAEFGGKSFDVVKISLNPFEGDPSAERMLGYEGATFEMVVGDKVPGGILSLTSTYRSPVPDAPKLDETITLESVRETTP